MAQENRLRADRLLVEQGHFESRARAQAAIAAGLVEADGGTVARASELIARGARISARAPHPYVSRGGSKLEAALEAFAVDPSGLVCLDVGASTGGFSDVLLRRGASLVQAVDVGRGQLHPSLAGHPRLLAMEGRDVRDLDPAELRAAPSLVVVDVSFISLRLVLPRLLRLAAASWVLIALIKPQFEAGRGRVGRGGIVRDEAVQADICAAVQAHVQAMGFAILGLIPSPIAGGDGNREFLIGARRGG